MRFLKSRKQGKKERAKDKGGGNERIRKRKKESLDGGEE